MTAISAKTIVSIQPVWISATHFWDMRKLYRVIRIHEPESFVKINISTTYE